MKDGYLPDGPGNKCQRYNRNTGNDLPVDDPDISDRISVQADKRQRYHKMRKRQPVVTISQERILIICINQCFITQLKPVAQLFRKHLLVLHQPAQFGFGGHGGKAACNQGNHEEQDQ